LAAAQASVDDKWMDGMDGLRQSIKMDDEKIDSQTAFTEHAWGEEMRDEE